MTRKLILVAALLTLSILTAAEARFDAAASTLEFVTPDPAECRTAPRSIDSIVAALATPLAGTPLTAAPESDSSAGHPADAETTRAVMAVAREVTACGNAGDYRRLFALYTDKGLRVFAADRGITPEQLVRALEATPVPLSTETWQAVRIRETRLLSDGRVTTLADFRSPNGIGTVFVTLIPQGDRYLVDSEVVVPSPSATPTP